MPMSLSPNWFYSTPEWRALSERVKERDGHRCTVARLIGGQCGGLLHAHHIESLTDRPDLGLKIDNCASVCAVHHPKWERIRRLLSKEPKVPACRHRHPYRSGREQCENERRRSVGLPPIEHRELVEA